MNTETFTSKTMSRFLSRNHSKGSMTTQGNGSQSSGRRTYHSMTDSQPSTKLIAAGSAEHKSDHVAGYKSPLGGSSLTTQPSTTNVVLFGETGVGKSSVINLIARRAIAKVSPDVNGCTMQSTRHEIDFDGMKFAIFDTIGLEEPQMGVNGYLKAIEKAYELILELSGAGGIHLLLFCLRGSRITATTQSNYRLFCEILCSKRVPIALVFTGLEMEVEMEDWWTRNEAHIKRYGIESQDHACITAVRGDTPGEDLKYTESQKRVRELLKNIAHKNEAFLLEPHSWFAKVAREMKSLIEKGLSPKGRDVMKVLTRRCKLDPVTARKIADMMKKGETQAKDKNQVEQAGNTEGSNPEAGAGGRDGRDGAKGGETYNDAEAEPRVDEGKDGRQHRYGSMDSGEARRYQGEVNYIDVLHTGRSSVPRLK